MGWEERGSGRYYYRKRRAGDRVISEYVGPGMIGRLASIFDGERHQERKQQREARKAEREAVQTAEAAVDHICGMVRVLTSAALLSAGYHTHKGEWRRKSKDE